MTRKTHLVVYQSYETSCDEVWVIDRLDLLHKQAFEFNAFLAGWSHCLNSYLQHRGGDYFFACVEADAQWQRREDKHGRRSLFALRPEQCVCEMSNPEHSRLYPALVEEGKLSDFAVDVEQDYSTLYILFDQHFEAVEGTCLMSEDSRAEITKLFKEVYAEYNAELPAFAHAFLVKTGLQKRLYLDDYVDFIEAQQKLMLPGKYTTAQN